VFALWLTVGFQITFLPQFWLGTNGMNRRIADYPEQLEGANLFSSISSFLLGASFLLLVYILVSGARRGPVAGPNPWNASTLEWQVSSPPPEHNFSGQPRVVDHPYVYGTAGSRHAEFVGVTTTREQAEDRNGDHDG
jgi:cytochrome c oxidase subunit 1